MLLIFIGALVIALGGWLSGTIWNKSPFFAVFFLLVTAAYGGFTFYQGAKKRQRGRRLHQDDLVPGQILNIVSWDSYRVLFLDKNGFERFLLLNETLPKDKTCFRVTKTDRKITLEPIADPESSEAFEMPDDYRPA